MAVYHATRQRTGPFGAIGLARAAIAAPGYAPRRTSSAGAAAPALPRRRARIAVRSGRRSGRVGLTLAAIVVAFLLAFFSLAQTVRVTATGYDIDRLVVERDRIEAQRQELLSDLNRLGREPAIRKQAIDVGLAPLVAPLVVTPK